MLLQRLPLRTARVADRPLSGRTAQRQPAAAPRRPHRRPGRPRRRDLPRLLRAGDLLVFNDTRVVPARLFGRRRAAARLSCCSSACSAAHARSSSCVPASQQSPALESTSPAVRCATVTGRDGDFWVVELDARRRDVSRTARRDAAAAVHRSREPSQPIASATRPCMRATPGAVAAPTAGLHFDDGAARRAARGAASSSRYVTLHVGAGTFPPVRVRATSSEHRMHAERLHVAPTPVRRSSAARARGGRVVAVGTTACARSRRRRRAAQLAAVRGRNARCSSTPGFRFRVVDALVTNFHLPESTLLMLVCAFAGTRGACSPPTGTRSSAALPLLQLRRRDVRRRRHRRAKRAMKFELLESATAPRGAAGSHFARGAVETPAFMPVGTYGTVKAHDARGARRRSAPQIILGNTFHLMLRPGIEVIRAPRRPARVHALAAADPHRLGRLPGVQPRRPAQDHRGGRRVPLARRRRRRSFLTPERSMRDAARARLRHRDGLRRVHRRTRPTEDAARESMELSLRWAKRSRDAFSDAATRDGAVRHRAGRHVPAACGSESLGGLVEIGFDGYAIGGLAVGEPEAGARLAVLEALAPHAAGRPAALPHGRRHAGRPRRGRAPRHRHVRLRDADAQRAQRPPLHERGRDQHPQRAVPGGYRAARPALRLLHLPELLAAPTCATCDQCNEILGARLATLHNLHYYQRLMARMRAALDAGTFARFADRFPGRTRGCRHGDGQPGGPSGIIAGLFCDAPAGGGRQEFSSWIG